MREVNLIVLHHSASSRDSTTTEMIREWHKQRRFSDIGYHWVVLGSGVIESGRSEEWSGAHCKGFNRNSIGVCVVGDFTKEEPSEEQLESLRGLLSELLLRYPGAQIKPHNELRDTECPGRLMEFLDV